MNEYYMNVNFEKGKIDTNLFKLVQNDYNSTKINFTFDKEGTIQFKMLFPDKTTAYIDEIVNNEIILKEGLLSQNGTYKIEICVNGVDSRLTDYPTHEFIVRKELINTDEIVEPDDRVPILDNLINQVNQTKEDVENLEEDIETALEDVNQAIEQTNNLDLDVNKVGKEATIDVTKKDGTTKSVKVYDGVSLQFMWQGTSLGIKTDDMQDYIFVNLQGIQGIPGPQGEPFRIKKTYPSVEAMNADFDNMNVGDYVMIASTVEVEDNAKLYTRGDYQWIFITDFSGATGIKGETGATPIIHIGTVTSGDEPSVTISGTAENPIFNFVLQAGPQGEIGPQGETGATGNGIASIAKTSTSGLVDTYTITYTNGTTTTFQITNGEDGEVTQAQLDALERKVDYNKKYSNALAKIEGEGTSLTLDDTAECPMPMVLTPSEIEQASTTGKNLANVSDSYSFTRAFNIFNLPAGTYYVSCGTVTKGGANSPEIGYSDAHIALTSNMLNSQLILSADTGITLYSNGWNYTDSSVTSIVNNLMITKTEISSIDDYEPYTGGNPAPSPDYPFDIHTISGDNEIVLKNKNLYIIGEDTNGYINNNGTVGASSVTKTSNFIPIKSNKDYAISFDYITIANTSARQIAYYNENKDFISLITYIPTNKVKTFTTPENVSFVRFSYPSEVYDIQLEQKVNKTPYTPHEEQSLPLNLPLGNMFDKTKFTYDNNYYDDNGNVLAGTTTGRSTSFIKVRPNHSYIINGFGYATQDESKSTIYRMYYFNSSKAFISRTISFDGQIEYTFTAPSNCYYIGFQCITRTGGDYIRTVLDDLNTINIEDTETLGQPALEYCKIGNYEDEFVIPDKQLFDESTMQINKNISVDGVFGNYSGCCASETYISVLPNTQYTFSCNTSFQLRVNKYDLYKTSIERIYQSGKTFTFTTDDNCYFVRLSLYASNSSLSNDFLNDKTFQLEKGSATEYEPYNPDGKWYLKKNVGKELITTFNSKSGTTANNMFNTNVISNILKPSDGTKVSNMMSNYFISKAPNTLYTNDTLGIGINTSGTICCAFGLNSQIDTVELANQWLNSNELIAYIPLATPEYIPLNDTLQSQLTEIYNWLVSYQEQTNISQVNNDLPFVIKVSAIYDLNKLVARVVALEEE